MSWLNSFSSEKDVKNEMLRLEFTSESPPEAVFIDLSYSQGFALSYGLSVMLMATVLGYHLWRMTRRLVVLNSGSGRAFRFLVGQLPLTVGVALWSGFLIGTPVGLLLALLIWMKV